VKKRRGADDKNLAVTVRGRSKLEGRVFRQSPGGGAGRLRGAAGSLELGRIKTTVATLTLDGARDGEGT